MMENKWPQGQRGGGGAQHRCASLNNAISEGKERKGKGGVLDLNKKSPARWGKADWLVR